MSLCTRKRARAYDDRHHSKRQRVADEYTAVQKRNVSIDVLPFELLQKVFNFIDIESMRSVSLVNKEWNATLSSIDISMFPFDGDIIEFFSYRKPSLLQYAAIHNMYRSHCNPGFRDEMFSKLNRFEADRIVMHYWLIIQKNTRDIPYKHFEDKIIDFRTFDVARPHQAAVLHIILNFSPRQKINDTVCHLLHRFDNVFDLPRFKCFERLMNRPKMIEALNRSCVPMRCAGDINKRVNGAKQLEYLEYLVAQYPEIVQPDFYGEPLICRIARYDSCLAVPMAQLLLKHGASRDTKTDTFFEYPCVVAIRNHNIELAELLYFPGCVVGQQTLMIVLKRAGIVDKQYEDMMEKYTQSKNKQK